MDISHFGLFDLTGRAPRWTDDGPGMAELGAPPARIAHTVIANDNKARNSKAAAWSGNASSGRAPRRGRSLLGFMAGRSRQPGPA